MLTAVPRGFSTIDANVALFPSVWQAAIDKLWLFRMVLKHVYALEMEGARVRVILGLRRIGSRDDIHLNRDHSLAHGGGHP